MLPLNGTISLNFWTINSRVMRVDQKALLQTKPATQVNLPLVVTFNKAFPNIKNVIDKY